MKAPVRGPKQHSRNTRGNNGELAPAGYWLRPPPEATPGGTFFTSKYGVPTMPKNHPGYRAEPDPGHHPKPFRPDTLSERTRQQHSKAKVTLPSVHVTAVSEDPDA